MLQPQWITNNAGAWYVRVAQWVEVGWNHAGTVPRMIVKQPNKVHSTGQVERSRGCKHHENMMHIALSNDDHQKHTIWCLPLDITILAWTFAYVQVSLIAISFCNAVKLFLYFCWHGLSHVGKVSWTILFRENRMHNKCQCQCSRKQESLL